ncbi:MAG TPA: AraC family transcriptional regulator [Pyrinomonadaceae bacterium]|jgi:AraC family transcriptional regulator of arabinose operon
MDQRVRTLAAFMQDNFYQPLIRDELARVVNLSPSRLRHLFKEATGITLAEYQRNVRMKRAKTLLETSLLSVKEIMASVGAHNKSHFISDFKKLYGMTPTEYRRSWMMTPPPDNSPVEYL